METAQAADGFSMDSLPAIGSSLPTVQARSTANLDAGFATYASAALAAVPNPTGPIGSEQRSDPATEQRRMMHFISHVNADCFISLLQIVDPMPDDYRARAEYKRFYRQLHDTLEIPLSPPDQPAGLPTA
jgi:hypothetical protein